jgi:3-hydroxyacyl-[acyl-carrier-protein] dehydratase
MATEGKGEAKVIFDSVQIQKILPHRYPFLMVDKIIELEDNKRVVGIKNVSINEEFFLGHFPGRPVMPGVLVLEALAQTAAILARVSDGGVDPQKTVFLVGADEVRWKKMVLPGDTLHLVVESVKKRRPMWVMKGHALVDGKVAATATFSAIEVT